MIEIYEERKTKERKQEIKDERRKDNLSRGQNYCGMGHVDRQRPRDKQIYNSRCQVMARKQKWKIGVF
jgi:hypothetical protein